MTTPNGRCSGSCSGHSYDRTGKLRHQRIPFGVIEADPPTPLPTIAGRALQALRLAARWLATPPGTPIRAPAPATASAAATGGPAAGERSASGSRGCACGTRHPQPTAPARRRDPRTLWQVPEDAARERRVLIDGLPIDPLAFDADPDAFLRAVFGPTYGEAR